MSVQSKHLIINGNIITDSTINFGNKEVQSSIVKFFNDRNATAPSKDLIPPEFICSSIDKNLDWFRYCFIIPSHKQRFSFKVSRGVYKTKPLLIPALYFGVNYSRNQFSLPSVKVNAITKVNKVVSFYRIPLPNVSQSAGHSRICYATPGWTRAREIQKRSQDLRGLEGWPAYIEDAFDWIKLYFESYCAFDSILDAALIKPLIPKEIAVGVTEGLASKLPTSTANNMFVKNTIGIYEWWAQRDNVESIVARFYKANSSDIGVGKDELQYLQNNLDLDSL